MVMNPSHIERSTLCAAETSSIFAGATTNLPSLSSWSSSQAGIRQSVQFCLSRCTERERISRPRLSPRVRLALEWKNILRKDC